MSYVQINLPQTVFTAYNVLGQEWGKVDISGRSSQKQMAVENDKIIKWELHLINGMKGSQPSNIHREFTMKYLIYKI